MEKRGLAAGSGGPKPPAGQRNAERTKGAILDAAKIAFSRRGYTDVGMREIAQEAGVNSALIIRYFGSKEGLFEAVLDSLLPVTPLTQLERARYGELAVDLIINRAHSSGIRIIALAAANPGLRALSMEKCERLVIGPLAEMLGPPDARDRATSLLTLWSGFLLLWNLELPSLIRMDPPLRKWLEEATQAIVDGSAVGGWGPAP